MASKANAQIEITASSSRLRAGLAAAAQAVRAFSGTLAGTLARGVSAGFKGLSKASLGDTAKRAVGNFGGDMLTRGVDAIAGAANEVRDFERSLMRFKMAAGDDAGTLRDLRNSIREVSRETGIADAQVLAGAATYAGLTGDAAGAAQAMRSFARIAQASGASVDEVATATAAMQISLGLRAEDIEAAFSGMIVQGKAGAVELKDLAAELSALAPQFANFRGGKSLSGIREMGAAFQVIRTGAGSATMAATNFRALMSSIADPRVIKGLEKLKIKIFDKDPATGLVTMRSASQIFEDLATNQKLLDPRVMAKVFGREEARAALRALQAHIGMYRDLRAAAEDTGAVQRDLNEFLESDAGRLDKAFNSMKVAIAEAFTPERIAAFARAVEDVAGKLGPLVEALGAAGSILGGLMGVGKAARGAIAGDVNPFDEVAARATLARGGAAFMGDNSREAMERRRRQAERDVRAAPAFRAARDRILGAEVNERTTPESIRRAVLASFQGDLTNGGMNSTPEDDAARIAGSMYLRNAGVTPAKQNEIFGQEFAKALKEAGVIDLLAGIVDGVRGNRSTSVEIDGNQVAKSVDKSTNARRSPQ